MADSTARRPGQWPAYTTHAMALLRGHRLGSTADHGDHLASFVTRGFRPRQRRSQTKGCWLVVGNEGNQAVRQGSVAVITEGAPDVAFFVVEELTHDSC